MEKGSMDLKNEYKFFNDNIDALIEKYSNKYIIIKDDDIKGDFDSFDRAYEAAIKKYELGSFLIQHCNKDENNSGQVFNSRVFFCN